MKLRDMTLKIVTLMIIGLLLIISAVVGLSFLELVIDAGVLLYFYQIAYILTLGVCFNGAVLSLFSLLKGRLIIKVMLGYLIVLVLSIALMHLVIV